MKKRLAFKWKTLLWALPMMVLTFLTGCEKDSLKNEIEGAYLGTYTWTNLTQSWSLNSTPIIELKNGKYTYYGLSNDSYYDSGSGTYKIKGNKIIFELSNFPVPIQSIGVVDSWLLKGEYEFTFEAGKLVFSKTTKVMAHEYKYQFDLKKDIGRK